jgi:hypothetical protein
MVSLLLTAEICKLETFAVTSAWITEKTIAGSERTQHETSTLRSHRRCNSHHATGTISTTAIRTSKRTIESIHDCKSHWIRAYKIDCSIFYTRISHICCKKHKKRKMIR